MRARVLETPAPIRDHPLAERDVPRPAPGPTEMLLRVPVCGACRTASIMDAVPPGRIMPTPWLTMRLPR